MPAGLVPTRLPLGPHLLGSAIRGRRILPNIRRATTGGFPRGGGPVRYRGLRRLIGPRQSRQKRGLKRTTIVKISRRPRSIQRARTSFEASLNQA